MKYYARLFLVMIFMLNIGDSFAKCYDVTIDVNGMVCDFCARSIEKVFSKREEILSVNVDLDESQIKIMLKPEKEISDSILENLIRDSGYNIVKINRNCDE